MIEASAARKNTLQFHSYSQSVSTGLPTKKAKSLNLFLGVEKELAKILGKIGIGKGG